MKKCLAEYLVRGDLLDNERREMIYLLGGFEVIVDENITIGDLLKNGGVQVADIKYPRTVALRIENETWTVPWRILKHFKKIRANQTLARKILDAKSNDDELLGGPPPPTVDIPDLEDGEAFSKLCGLIIMTQNMMNSIDELTEDFVSRMDEVALFLGPDENALNYYSLTAKWREKRLYNWEIVKPTPLCYDVAFNYGEPMSKPDPRFLWPTTASEGNLNVKVFELGRFSEIHDFGIVFHRMKAKFRIGVLGSWKCDDELEIVLYVRTKIFDFQQVVYTYTEENCNALIEIETEASDEEMASLASVRLDQPEIMVFVCSTAEEIKTINIDSAWIELEFLNMETF
jgi:hypothetical protein